MADQNKKIYFVVGAAVLLVLIAAAVFYFVYLRKPAEITEEPLAPPEKASEPAISGTLPSIAPNIEVVVPELNPIDKVNPYKDVYKNPFE